VTALASGLQERGIDVTLVVPEPSGSVSDRLENVAIHSVSVDGVGDISFVRAAKIAREADRVADRENARLQIEHSTLAGVGTLVGASNYVLDMHDLGYARFDHVQHPLSPVLKRGVRWLERRAVRSAADIVVVSEYMQSALEDWGIDSEQVNVVPNGFFDERIESAEGLETVEGRVCFLGTLHPKVDIEAFQEVASLSNVSEMVVIGDGAQRDSIESLAEGNESIRVMGRLPDEEAFELLGSAAVALNPQTQSELQRSSSPVKLYYYAALGLPMVVAPGPTVVEDLVERDAAVTAVGGEAVAEAVDELLSDDERRANVGVNARDASEAFRWARRVDMFETIYRNTSEV
jgi:glycosyltransferase involved in cell wall biosynthesis